jgi:hypothetical protein
MLNPFFCLVINQFDPPKFPCFIPHGIRIQLRFGMHAGSPAGGQACQELPGQQQKVHDFWMITWVGG